MGAFDQYKRFVPKEATNGKRVVKIYKKLFRKRHEVKVESVTIDYLMADNGGWRVKVFYTIGGKTWETTNVYLDFPTKKDIKSVAKLVYKKYTTK